MFPSQDSYKLSGFEPGHSGHDFCSLLAPLALLRDTFTHPEGVAGSVLCRLLTGGVFGWIGGACSSYTLLAVAVERYHSVIYPLSVKSKFTARKLKVCVQVSHVKIL